MIVYGTNYNKYYFLYKKTDNFIELIFGSTPQIHYITVELRINRYYVVVDKLKKCELFLVHNSDQLYSFLVNGLVKELFFNVAKNYRDGLLEKLYKNLIISNAEKNKIKSIKLLEKFYQVGSYLFLNKTNILEEKTKYINILWENEKSRYHADYIATKISNFIIRKEAKNNIFLHYLFYYILLNKIAENTKKNMSILNLETYFISGNTYLGSEKIKDLFRSYNIKLDNDNILITSYTKDDFTIMSSIDNPNSLSYCYYKHNLFKKEISINFRDTEYIIIRNLAKKNGEKSIELAIEELWRILNTSMESGYNLVLTELFYFVFYFILKKHNYIKKIGTYYLTNKEYMSTNMLVECKRSRRNASLHYIHEFISGNYSKKESSSRYILLEIYESNFRIIEHDCTINFIKTRFSNTLKEKEIKNFEKIKSLEFDNKLFNVNINTKLILSDTDLRIIYEMDI